MSSPATSTDPVVSPRNAPGLVRNLEETWVGLVSGGLAALIVRLGIPLPSDAEGTPLVGLARLTERHPVAVWAVLFVGLAGIFYYWRRARAPAAMPGTSERQRPGEDWQRFALLIAVAALAAWLSRARFVEIVRVESSSMLPTLETGDRILMNRAAFGVQVPFRSGARAIPTRRGDLIVFTPPSTVGELGVASAKATALPELKRVMGLPGDLIRMRGPRPVINGWVVPSCFVGPYPYFNGREAELSQLHLEYLDGGVHLALYSSLPSNGGSDLRDREYTVGENEVFVLGDNRGNSRDSRSFHQGTGGGVPKELILGRATRLITGTLRSGAATFDQLFTKLDQASLESDLHLEGMDVSGLHARLAECLERTPDVTSPPGQG